MDSKQFETTGITAKYRAREWERATNAFHKSWTRFKTICLRHRFCHFYCFSEFECFGLWFSMHTNIIRALHTNSQFVFRLFFLSRKTTGSTFRFSSSALSPFAIILYLRIIYLCLAWLPFRMYFVDNVCKHTSCTNSISTSAQTNLTPPLIVALYHKPHSGKKCGRARINKTKIGLCEQKPLWL